MYQCPKCGSNRIRMQYPDISCIACGHNDSLMDFPISQEHHRALCQEYNRPVPSALMGVPEIGTNVPIKGTEAMSQPHQDAFEQLQGRVNWLQGRLEEHLERPKKRRSSKYI